ncbi:CYFA0S15e01046g1_1 [Cyberlindnera fabianii]|uniref:CYFA0S15e01046g1_1 n=1 Tax=Cyberlindnera fabianii TaxID=36022 RepID=A0A061BCH2_CYBFA|nr:CYFA0S15e01046g1_1 [Cyberlindnera fabianii]
MTAVPQLSGEQLSESVSLSRASAEGAELSIEQLLELYMEANEDLIKIQGLLQGSATTDPFYNDLSVMMETVLRKRDNYQLQMISHARNSKDSLHFLTKSSAIHNPSVLSTTHFNGNNNNDVDGVSVPPLSLHNDHNRIPNNNTTHSDVDKSTSQAITSVVPNNTSMKTSKDKSKGTSKETSSPPSSSLSKLSSTDNDANQGACSINVTTNTPPASVGSPAGSPAAASPPVTGKTTSTVNTSTSTTTTSTPPATSASSSSPAPTILPTGEYDDSTVSLILKSISEAKFKPDEAQKFITALLDQTKEKQEASQITSRVSSIVLAPSKEHYASTMDMRYFIADKIIEMFGDRNDLLNLFAANKPMMTRIGNWLRFDQRQKDQEKSLKCLKFIQVLQPTLRQLSDFKVIEILQRISKKNDSCTAIAKTIIKSAESKQTSQQTAGEKRFSVTGYLSQSKRKVNSPPQDSVVTDSPVPKEPVKEPRDVKGILKKAGKPRSKKTVKFRDTKLQEYRYIESRSDEITSELDHERAKAMELSEAEVHKQHVTDTPSDLDKSSGFTPLTPAPTPTPTPSHTPTYTPLTDGHSTTPDHQPSIVLYNGIKEFDGTVAWFTPPLIDFNFDPEYAKSPGSVTRGGTLDLVLTDDSTSQTGIPSLSPNSHPDSPLEHDHLVTPKRYYDYRETLKGVPSSYASYGERSPGPTPWKKDTVEPSISAYIPPIPDTNDQSKKRPRDAENVWTPSLTPAFSGFAARDAKRARGNGGPLPIQDGTIGHHHTSGEPTPHRAGVLGAPPSELPNGIIQLRLGDVRPMVSQGAYTLPPHKYVERCTYYPKNCRWGQACQFVHLDPEKRNRSQVKPPGSNRR